MLTHGTCTCSLSTWKNSLVDSFPCQHFLYVISLGFAECLCELKPLTKTCCRLRNWVLEPTSYKIKIAKMLVFFIILLLSCMHSLSFLSFACSQKGTKHFDIILCKDHHFRNLFTSQKSISKHYTLFFYRFIILILSIQKHSV